MRRVSIRFLPIVALVVVVLAGCAVPFSYETETSTISLPVDPALAAPEREETVDIPDQATRDELIYDEVRIYYEVTTDSVFQVDVQVWVSDDQTTDDSYSASEDELILDVTVSGGETVSGWSASEELVAALNAQNEVFVVGGTAKNTTGTGTVTITLHAEITGTVQPLQ